MASNASNALQVRRYSIWRPSNAVTAQPVNAWTTLLRDVHRRVPHKLLHSKPIPTQATLSHHGDDLHRHQASLLVPAIGLTLMDVNASNVILQTIYGTLQAESAPAAQQGSSTTARKRSVRRNHKERKPTTPTHMHPMSGAGFHKEITPLRIALTTVLILTDIPVSSANIR